jgi:hypothetical protein
MSNEKKRRPDDTLRAIANAKRFLARGSPARASLVRAERVIEKHDLILLPDCADCN